MRYRETDNLLNAERRDIQLQALRDVAKGFVLVIMALLVGCALVLVVMP